MLLVEKRIGIIGAIGDIFSQFTDEVFVDFGQELVTEAVFGRGFVAEPRFEQAHHILGAVLPPVHAVRQSGNGRVGLEVLVQRLPLGLRGLVVAGQAVVEQGMVGRTLHVGLAAKSIDAAACHADIAKQELDEIEFADDIIDKLKKKNVISPKK